MDAAQRQGPFPSFCVLGMTDLDTGLDLAFMYSLIRFDVEISEGDMQGEGVVLEKYNRVRDEMLDDDHGDWHALEDWVLDVMEDSLEALAPTPQPDSRKPITLTWYFSPPSYAFKLVNRQGSACAVQVDHDAQVQARQKPAVWIVDEIPRTGAFDSHCLLRSDLPSVPIILASELERVDEELSEVDLSDVPRKVRQVKTGETFCFKAAPHSDYFVREIKILSKIQSSGRFQEPASGIVSGTDDREILDNINGRMHGPMSGFIKKHFASFKYVCHDSSLEIQITGGTTSRCAIPAAAPSPENFLQWFCSYTSRELDGARGSWHISGSSESPGDGARLLLTMSTPPASNIPGLQTKWDQVQVIGQFYDGNVCYQDGLLRLYRSAHQVFLSQPTRLFLHGFYIRGSLIELWVFDRSGLYCSDVFDIRGDFTQFLSTILSYQRMTDQELGRLNVIETGEGGNLDSILMPSLGKLYLDRQPIATREGPIGAGTTCYLARLPDSDQWNYVLKFKWRWAKRRPEDELLKLAKRKCVWGAISLEYYREVESTAHLRQGLRWGVYRKFSEAHPRDGCIEEQHQEVTNTDGFKEHTEETKDFLENRIFTYVVTSPVGRPLLSFQSLIELLQVLHDAIKCHRSLFNAEILHQDISPGNIIILDDQNSEKPKGVLIDLDLAMELKGSESDFGITGTRPFMAIGVLKGEPHTYRHDLESFFYVFLWMVITNHAEDLPETSKLRQWSNDEGIEVHKSLDMYPDGFQHILEEFPPEFRPLKPVAESLRQILFPLRDGVIWTGTDRLPESLDKLYDGMMHAFKEFIENQDEG